MKQTSRAQPTRQSSPNTQTGTSSSAGLSNQAQLDRMASLQGGGNPPAKKLSSLPGVDDGTNSDFAVATKSNVENRSVKNTEDATFQYMNDDYFRGYTLESDGVGGQEVHMGRPGETQRKTETTGLAKAGGIDTAAEYRAMLTRDFNFNGVVKKYTDIARIDAGPKETLEGETLWKRSETPFLKDVIAAVYPGLKFDDPTVQPAIEIARNIWSYAMRGMDCQGRTDIDEMQGLLYVFDKQIAGSSNTNTKMADEKKEENWFIVPGTEDWPQPIKLLKGDGRHGRATILTTRHLLTEMTTPSDDLTGFKESYLLVDTSQSMRADEYKKLAQLIDAGGIAGDVALAGFNDDKTTLKKIQDGKPLDGAEAGKILSEAGEGRGEKALTAAPSGGTQEEGLANALRWIQEMPPSEGTPRQLVIATDEPDFNPTVLVDLQKAAREKNVRVKVVYSFKKSNEATFSTKKGPWGSTNSDSFVVVDVTALGPITNFLVDRDEGDGKGPKKQLDWWLAAKSQGAETKSWSATGR